jgi:hypothetical protein
MHDTSILAPCPRAAVRTVFTATLVWLASIVAISALGVLTLERRAIVPLAIIGTTIALVALHRRGGSLRAVVDALDVRLVIGFHALRAVIGTGFLVLAARGELDPVFARIAGWGDIAVGVGAMLVVAGGVRPGRAWTRVRAAWNLFGSLDIAIVIVVAQSILFFSDHPQTMLGLVAFPWLLVPFVIVPIVISTHALLFARLRT